MTRTPMFKRLLAFGVLAAAGPAMAADNPLKQAEFTQVINRVSVVRGGNQSVPAVRGMVFRAPETAQTGPNARAELQAGDGTITRLGANTRFRFGEEPRTIFLDEGNVLFYSPTGKGGGTIKTAGASAGVMGSTNMVSTTSNGGFKVLSLEHRTKVRFEKLGLFGQTRVLKPGQMTFVLPGATRMPPVFEFRLDTLVANSELIRGFGNQLPSLSAILHNASEQAKQIAAGKKQDTGKMIGDVDNNGNADLIDGNTRQAFFAAQVEGLLSDQVEDIVEDLDPWELDLIIDTSTVPSEFIIVSKPELVRFFNYYGIPTDILDDTGGPDGYGLEISLSNLAVAAARNIYIRSATVNLAPYASNSAFAFMAGNYIYIENSVHFTGYDGPLGLFARDGIEIAPGSEIVHDGYSLTLQTGQGVDYQNVTFSSSGAFSLEVGGTMDLNGVTIDADGPVFLYAGAIGTPTFHADDLAISALGGIAIEAEGDIDINDALLLVTGYYGPSYIDEGVSITSYSGDVYLNNLNLDAGSLRVEALNGGLIVQGTMGQVDLPLGATSMAARTITLSNVTFPFGSSVNLYSQYGMLAPNANTGASPLTGYVNFYQNVKYGTDAAQDHVPYSQGGTGYLGSEIQIDTLSNYSGGSPPPSSL